jgi:heme exporter protein B
MAAVPVARAIAGSVTSSRRSVSFGRAVRLVAAKDIRIEKAARVSTSQVLPFAGIVLLMFAFASDPDRTALSGVAPGMFWTSVVLAAVLAASRSAAIEVQNNASDGLRLSGVDPGAVFLGKAFAVLAQLLLLEVVLLFGLIAVYGYSIEHPFVLVFSAIAASVGIAAAGVIYATVAASLRVRDTLVPLLTLPALAPVALGGSRAWSAASQVGPGDGLRWVQLLAVFAVLFTAFGVAAYGALIEEG